MAAETQKTDEIPRLYEISTLLDNAQLAGGIGEQHESLFEEILQAAKGARGAKVLSAQLIPKYLKYFRKSLDKAMNTLMDLCEEDDVQIRVAAIRSLPTIAKDTSEVLPKVADILGQLLQAEDRLELDNVKHALTSLVRLDVVGTLEALFNHILSGDELLRDKSVAFIFEKVTPLRGELIDNNPEVQKAISENVKKVLQDASGHEFQIFFDFLRSFPVNSDSNELLDVVATQIESNADFKPEEQHVNVLVTCLKLVQPFYQKGITSVRIAQYLANKMFPVINQLNEAQQSLVIKQLVELVPHISGDEAKELVKPVYDLLLAHAPIANEAKTNFTHTEAALLLFHHIAPKAPGQLRTLCGITIMTGQPSDLAGEPAVDRRKDLEARLKVLEEGTKAYVVKVKHALDILQKDLVTAKDAAKKEELHTTKATLDVALKTTQNIQSLAQALHKESPVFLKLTPSWKTTAGKQPEVKKADVVGKRRMLSLKSSAPKPAAKPAPAKATPAPTAKASPTLKPSPKIAAKPAPTTTTTTATEEKKAARPAFNTVYVPPSRGGQTVLTKRKDNEEVATPATTGESKKFKGRGTRTNF